MTSYCDFTQNNYKVITVLVVAILLVSLTSCATVGGRDGLSLIEAINQSAQRMAEDLPTGTRVAIVAFESENHNLSDFIMEELTGALFDMGIEVADRQNLEFVFRELEFQMAGHVSDETAVSVGRFLGAEMVITGQLRDLGSVQRLMTTAVHVETALRGSIPRFDVRNDRATQNMIAALGRQTTVMVSRFSVNEHTVPQTAGTYLDRGILFASRGEWELAILDFTEALRLNPNLAAAYILRGRALRASVSQVTAILEDFADIATVSRLRRELSANQMQILKRAISDFTQAIRLDPHNFMAYVERGRARLDKNEADLAIADFNLAMRLRPDSASLYIMRGVTHTQRGDLDQAITDFNQAIWLGSDSSSVFYNAFFNRGNVRSLRGELDQAIADFTESIRFNNNHAWTFYGRGWAYLRRDDFDLAIADFNEAIRLHPNFAAAFQSRGQAYFRRGDLGQAIADYTQAIRLDPNNAEGYFGRGNAHLGTGSLEQAIADFTQAMRLDPNNIGAFVARGAANLFKGKYCQAITDYEAALRIHSNYPMADHVANHVKNQLEHAIALFNSDKAVRLNPDCEEAHFERGWALFQWGDFDYAIAAFTHVIQLNPDSVAAFALRGLVYHSARKYYLAIADFEAALKIDPNHSDAYRIMAWLEAARLDAGW